VSTAAALASSTSSNAAGKKSQAKSDDSHNINAKSNETATTKGGAASSKTSLLDKAVRYLLDGDASPDRSVEEIWLMGVRLPEWGREDEKRVAAAAAGEKEGEFAFVWPRRASRPQPAGDVKAAEWLQITRRRPLFLSRCIHFHFHGYRRGRLRRRRCRHSRRTPRRRPLARRLPRSLLRASVVHVPRGLRAHPRLAVPVLVAASAILSERRAAFPFRVERRVGPVDGTWEQWDRE
jgi:hypothetical protein